LANAESELTTARSGQWLDWRRIVTWVFTGLAAVLVFYALVGPDRLGQMKPLVFLRIPIEGLLAAAFLLLLPPRPRRVVAIVLGALLGVVLLAKFFDLGFWETLDRPFDPASDWGFLPPAVDYLERTYGNAAAIAAVIGAIVLALALVVGSALALVRLSSLGARHRTVTLRTVGALAVVWVLMAVFGVEFVTDEPVAAYSAASLAYTDGNQVAAQIEDQRTFADHFANDPYTATPASQLLTGLRGKNVLLTFVESYGRVAIQNSDMSSRIDSVLDAGTVSLRNAGFDARSGFLTSSTAGGGSWLAHSTLQSGLWIDSPQRYTQLTESNRFTLANAFRRAGWQTASYQPANRYDWPEGAFYQYGKIIDSRNMGYQGKDYSFQSIPDQYTLSTVQRLEFATPRPAPLFAEIDLVSSHAPWEPVPDLVDWSRIGFGAGFTGAAGANDPTQTVFQQTIGTVHADYAETIEYSLRTVIQYLQTYGDKNLVMVFLGDHEPAPVVTGENADRDVPITIVAKDPNVLNQISGWGWTPGLRPSPEAPVWRMDQFRDRFLSAFGSQASR
jgi:hypothetical protein